MMELSLKDYRYLLLCLAISLVYFLTVTFIHKGASKKKKQNGYYTVKQNSPEPTPLYIRPEQVATYDDRPWRPFRWPYHQTMSIFKLDVNHWLDMDKYYVHYLKEKERIYHKYGDLNFTWLPESKMACEELLEVVKEHMLKRYPLLFTTKDGGAHVKNELTGEVLDFTSPLRDHPLMYVSKMAKEDFYIVMPREDGHQYLVAAAVPFPGGGFGIKGIIGKSIDSIHTSVPYYQEKLQKSLERWLNRMQPHDMVERASWHMTWDHKLRSNDVYELKRGDKIDSNIPPDQFNVRIERQALRKLPNSGAVVFTNHPIFYSIDEMKDEPFVPSILRKIVWDAPEKIVKSKHFDLVRERIDEYLQILIQRQISLGIIEGDAKIKTLPSYPFAHFVTDKHEEYGWINPSADTPETYNYLQQAEKELQI